ncbi:UDP-3-O-[3-hydroxymyristoyl] N-acetylglucosamine deacetylase [Cystobacter fuscus DSM 2262]|uniref:UDP-3-O-acyl-N-acetylglucosamine deacetylase n=1 Tax=Cystobacter fuscus (strain ATCC 25194 / DSM 2262 / NBRC 100088 / M29) TaxID=1242864 RepID=S9QTA3_CYSF2|nr:UDP-3-O-acyl-N-acetylglucosamine deacetylase [Cystobacter fuscus]EPX64524.1 UDP-3-O-[3-hydroxymyristoyl] N-acetylglucosamine deacetylase [Cystobacter fuscus DSM 2262]
MPYTSFNQRTLLQPVRCQGVGLHSGAPVNLSLLPAPVNHGIVFVRTDTPRPVAIPALTEYVVDTSLATTLGKDGVKVSTVEHLMSALAGMGLDNVRVEVDGPEVPIMDGSAAPFSSLISEAGVREQEEPRRLLVIKKTVTVTDGDKEASLSPAKGFRISCTVDFKHPLITEQSFELEFSDRCFAREISRARTFCFRRDVEMLQKMGLARGGSLDNAIVVDEFSILNPDGLRFADEFVRHKILDAIGDISLFGRPVMGHLRAFKTGHALNQKLVKAVLADPSSYEIVPARKHLELPELRLPELGLEPMVA